MIAGRYLGGLTRGCGSRNLTIASLALLTSAAGAVGNVAAIPEPAKPAAGAETTASFALVELFTSESCPSCPAADRLLSEMDEQARKRGQRLLPLAFHVDYWNTGSAADPFSTAAFARRQRAYAAAMNSNDIYTPQMVVNGRTAFIGSERATAERHVRTALNQPADIEVGITVDAAEKSADLLEVTFEVDRTVPNAVMQLAVVERNLSLSSRNAGRRNHYDNVVRVFKTVPLNQDARQTVGLSLPRGLNREEASVIGFVQDIRTMSVLGAMSLDLESTPVKRVASAKNSSLDIKASTATP